jgi:methionine-rich copper-binding protein CopC
MAIAATGSRIKRALPKIDFQGTRAILISIAVLSLLILTVSAVAAHAHAALAHASPSAGSTMRAAPHEVVLTFTERLEGAFSNLTVTDASGTEVRGKAQVNDNTMRIGLKPLNAGIYKVNWRAVSTDTHKIEGSFTFGVEAQ